MSDRLLVAFGSSSVFEKQEPIFREKSVGFDEQIYDYYFNCQDLIDRRCGSLDYILLYNRKHNNLYLHTSAQCR